MLHEFGQRFHVRRVLHGRKGNSVGRFLVGRLEGLKLAGFVTPTLAVGVQKTMLVKSKFEITHSGLNWLTQTQYPNATTKG